MIYLLTYCCVNSFSFRIQLNWILGHCLKFCHSKFTISKYLLSSFNSFVVCVVGKMLYSSSTYLMGHSGQNIKTFTSEESRVKTIVNNRAADATFSYWDTVPSLYKYWKILSSRTGFTQNWIVTNYLIWSEVSNIYTALTVFFVIFRLSPFLINSQIIKFSVCQNVWINQHIFPKICHIFEFSVKQFQKECSI